jgi:hypothetical protein
LLADSDAVATKCDDTLGAGRVNLFGLPQAVASDLDEKGHSLTPGWRALSTLDDGGPRAERAI